MTAEPLSHEDRIRDRVAALGLDWHAESFGAFAGERKEEYARMIVAAHILADESRRSLGQWIDAGRRAGMSWVDVGALLGISKQAAQQRFGGTRDDDAPDGAITVKLGTHILSERRLLDEHGEAGRELVAASALSLSFRQTDRAWAHLRTVGPIDPARQIGEDWRTAARWFVFHYYKRPVVTA
jgi:hypothetical protein